MSWLEAAARWYLVLLCGTWAMTPVVRWLCVALADRGTTVARPIALLVAVYPTWLLASLGVVSFGATAVVATALIVGVLGWVFILRAGWLTGDWLRGLLLAEGMSLVLFACYIWLRGYSPEILGTEKPMDVAFLASSARTLTMPPPDPWFAGEPINYYYLGYLLHGTLGRIAGVAPAIGFNLALATTFSMAAVAAFGIGWNALRPWFGSRLAAAGGALIALGVSLLGNLYAPWRLLQDTRETIDAWWWDSTAGIGWRSSRIVCDGPRTGNLCEFPSTATINEFPYFSFLLGDLHPHLMALPLTLVAISLAWNLARRGALASDASGWAWRVRLLVSGAVVGSLLALNTWDYPTSMIVLALGVLAAAGGSVLAAWSSIFLLGASSIIAWLPYLIAYEPPTSGTLGLPAWLANLPFLSSLFGTVALHTGERTSASEYLTMFGAPYTVGVTLLIWSTINQLDDASGRLPRPLLISWAALLVAAALLSAPVLLLCGIPLSLAIVLLQRQHGPDAQTFALTALSLAWTISILVEIVYIRDAFNDRMNTLFKFYYQTWTLYAVAAGVALCVLWARAPRASWQRPLIALATATMLIAGLAYPVVATFQWTDRLADWDGLDGLAYGEATAPGDVEAIRWLRAHSRPGDVVLEAAGCSYRPFSRLPFNRVSAFTGVPTVIGWGDNHQRQWRAGQSDLLSEIATRQDDVAQMFADPDSPLLDQYGIRWLFVGAYETGNWRAECPTAGPYSNVSNPGYPGPGWVEAFRSGDTRIYRRGTE